MRWGGDDKGLVIFVLARGFEFYLPEGELEAQQLRLKMMTLKEGER